MAFEESFGPISGRVTVQDAVYLKLREALLIGHFEPGQTITIAALAQSFDTSHMPVREALRRLAAENALEIARNGSARVPPVSVERLDDLCRARASIEGLATELATHQASAEDIARLEAIVTAHEANAERAEVYEMLLANREFHYSVYKISKSEVLIQLIETLWLRYGPYMHRLAAYAATEIASADPASYTTHHRRIIDAMKSRDSSRAKEEMVADIRNTQDLLRRLITA